MSDLLTHWAVMDDCRRVMPYIEGIAPEFSDCLSRHHHIARLGAICRAGGHWTPLILRWTREHWHDPSLHPEVEIKLAFCVAGLTHIACDLLMKELRIRTVLEDENSATPTADDVQRLVYAYQDTHVFRKVYRDGNEEPFSTFMMAETENDPARELKIMAEALFQRAIIGTRTVVREDTPLDQAFLENYVQDAAHSARKDSSSVRQIVGSRGLGHQRLYDWLREHRQGTEEGPDWRTIRDLLVQNPTDAKAQLDDLMINELPLYVDHERLVQVYHRPDEAKKAFYRIETDFYDEHDPAIQVARAIQDGETPSVADVRASLDLGSNRSFYGRALELTMEYERRGTNYWLGESPTLDTPNLVGESIERYRYRHDGEAERIANEKF